MVWSVTTLLVLALSACAAPSPRGPVERHARELRVTAGAVRSAGGSYHVNVGGMRAYLLGSERADGASVRFTYLGPSGSTSPLASGELRRQIGLKLRAADTCNVIYVMWHIEPTAGVRVSVKSNPGRHTHAECGAGGYVAQRPARVGAVPSIRRGERHVLSAELRGAVLRVDVDGALAWEGGLSREASALAGPVGVRTDNGAFDFDVTPWAERPPSRDGAGSPD